MIDLGTCPHCGWHLTMAEPITHAPNALQPCESDATTEPQPAKALKPITKAERTAKRRAYAREYAAKRRAAKANKST